MNEISTSAVLTRLSSKRRYRIVIVDSSKESTYVLRRLLERDGHEVKTANDGPSALELVKSAEPEVVVSCIALLGLDGFELARAIRQRLLPGILANKLACLLSRAVRFALEHGRTAKKNGYRELRQEWLRSYGELMQSLGTFLPLRAVA